MSKYKVIITVNEPAIPAGSDITHDSTSFYMASDKNFNNIIEQKLDETNDKYIWEPSYTLVKGEVVYCKTVMKFSNGKEIPSRPILFRGGETEFKASNIQIITPKLTLEEGVNILNTPRGGFKVFADGFNLYSGSEVHTSTTWRVRDTDGKVVWERVEDEDNLLDITIPQDLLEDNKVYEISAILHGHDNVSNPGKILVSSSLDRRSNAVMSGKLYNIFDSYIKVDIVAPLNNSGKLEVKTLDGVSRLLTPSKITNDLLQHQELIFNIPVTITNTTSQITASLLDGEEVVKSEVFKINKMPDEEPINSYRNILLTRESFTDIDRPHMATVQMYDDLDVIYQDKQLLTLDQSEGSVAASDVVMDYSSIADNCKPMIIGLRDDILASAVSDDEGNLTVRIDGIPDMLRLATYNITNLANIIVDNNKPLAMTKGEGNTLYISGIDKDSNEAKICKLNYKLGTVKIYNISDSNATSQVQILNKDDNSLVFLSDNVLYVLDKDSEALNKVKTLSDYYPLNPVMIKLNNGNMLLRIKDSSRKENLLVIDLETYVITNTVNTDSNETMQIVKNYMGAVNVMYKPDDQDNCVKHTFI